jgi:hypothetical protein
MQLVLPDRDHFIFLFATMEADPTKARTQDDATGCGCRVEPVAQRVEAQPRRYTVASESRGEGPEKEIADAFARDAL